MRDLSTLIRHYYDTAAAPVEAEEILSMQADAPSRVRPETPSGWLRRHPALVVAAAALITIVAIGGILLLVTGDSGGPVVTEPATTATTAVPPTTNGAPTTTLPAPATTQTTPPTTAAPATTVPPTTLPPPSPPGEAWSRVGETVSEPGTFLAGVADAGGRLIVVGTNQMPWPIEAVVVTP